MRRDPFCWEEERIEGAALRLVDIESGEERERLPADLEPFLAHAEGCFRCGELLALFLDVERQVRAGGGGGEVSIIILEEVREGPEIRLTERERVELPVALAADSADGKRGAEQEADIPSPRSYASADGRFLIRVMPNRSGEGATAVLLQCPEKERVPHIYRPEGEIEFGDGVHAALPGIPGPRLEIRFR